MEAVSSVDESSTQIGPTGSRTINTTQVFNSESGPSYNKACYSQGSAVQNQGHSLEQYQASAPNGNFSSVDETNQGDQNKGRG